MERERLDKWCEWGILGLVLAILIYGPLATGAIRPQDFQIIEWLTVGVLGVWLARVWICAEPRLLWPPVCWAVLAFVGYAIYRYFTAEIEYVARREVIKVFTYAMLFFAVINNLNRTEYASIIVGVLVAVAAAISLYALYQFLTNSNMVWNIIRPDQYAHRGSGTYINPNHLAGFLEMILPLGLAYTLTGRLKPTAKILLGYATLVVLVGITASFSRGGWAATILSLALFFLILVQQRDYRLPAIVFLSILVLAGTIFAVNTGTSGRRFQYLVKANRIDDVRFKLWPAATQMWEDHFWTGVGPGHYNYRFRQYRPPEIQVEPEWAHNDYLNTLVDWGVIGAALVAGTFLLWFYGAAKAWRAVRRSGNDRSSRRSNRVAFVLGAAVGLVALLIHSVVDFNLHIPANAMLAVTLMALLASHAKFTSDRWWVTNAILIRAGVTVIGLVALVYLGKQTLRTGAELALLQRAAKEKAYSPESQTILLAAHAAEPMNWKTIEEIGEYYRLRSWAGGNDYVEKAQEAMKWYEQGIKLDPYDPHLYLWYGMCLDWLDRHAEADKYFAKVNELDPNGFYSVAHQGWHRVQLGDYAGAKVFFERSLKLHWEDNVIASSYLEIVNRRLKENQSPPK